MGYEFIDNHYNQIASSLVIVNDSELSTIRMGTVFPRVDPLPSW